MYTLYKRKMTFMKSVTDNKGVAQAELHPLENEKDEGVVSSFKTTRYPYALPFKDEEDSHALPLSGLIAVFGVIEDYREAFFSASDWYAEMNTRILSCFRDLLAEISYDDDIVGRDLEKERVPDPIGVRLWEALNSEQNGNPSILDELRAVAGFRADSVVLRSIDPPVGWRDTTLAPYKAQRDAAAAVHRAMASALEFDDTNQALEKWKAKHPKATQAQITEKQQELARRAYLKAGGQYQEIHGLENATTAVVGGGGGAGVMVGAGGGKNPQPTPGKGKSGSDRRQSRSPGGNEKKGSDMTLEEFDEEFGGE
jgi:hypothetical protein